MPLASPRNLFALAFLACVAMMGAALYLEHVLGQEPCPLCIVQRILLIAFGLVCLVAGHGRVAQAMTTPSPAFHTRIPS